MKHLQFTCLLWDGATPLPHFWEHPVGSGWRCVRSTPHCSKIPDSGTPATRVAAHAHRRRRGRPMNGVENLKSRRAMVEQESSHHDASPEVSASAGLHLFLIRHGETEWTATGQHTGRTDIPLTARGEAQASELGQQLQGIAFARIFTSPLKRARQTCERVAPDRTFSCEPDLAEWDYGDYEGKTSADIRQQRPGWNVFRDGCPHGESPAQVSARADRLIVWLRRETGNIALFSHGQFGAVLAARWVGLAVTEARHLALDVASTSVLACDPHHPEVPVIALWNRVSFERFKSSFATPTEP